MDWLYKWWPVPVFLLGVYFIILAANRDHYWEKREGDSGGNEY